MNNHKRPVLGSLVYRARGYKILKEELTMASKSVFHRKCVKSHQYYVVSENIAAQKVSDMPEKQIQTLLLGSLVLVDNVYDNKFVDVKVIDYEYKYNIPEDAVFRCPIGSLLPVNKTLWKLVQAVASPIEKVEFLKDRELCEELSSIELGHRVYVLPSNSTSSSNLSFTPIAVVRYKGLINKMGLGVYFGVELLESFKECDSDGTFGGQRYFSCPPGRGMFVSVNRLRLRPEYNSDNVKGNVPIPFARDSERFSKILHNDKHVEDESYDEDLTNIAVRQKLNPGDRIVWLSESGPLYGSICWISHIDITAHVHLDNAMSTCKTVNCNRSQSVAIRVDELISENEFKHRHKCDSEKHSCSSPEMKRRCSISTTNNSVKTGDLLGICEENTSPNIDDSLWHIQHPVNRRKSDSQSDDSIENLSKQSIHDKNFTNTNVISGCSDDIYYDNPDSMSHTTDDSKAADLGIGSVVELSVNGEPQYGVIRWIGSLIYGDVPTKPIAGIEMEEENPSGCDGSLNGYKYFDCHPQRGYFILLSQCQKDSRFQDPAHLSSPDMKSQKEFGCPVIPGIIEPINATKRGHLLFGKYRGIQGHNNSCYLDATLFSMFAFTSVFDSLLLRPANKNDSTKYEEVQTVLREEIVNPLRQNLFVRADRVMKLRMLLDNCTSVTGLTCEEKDPEEFLTSLVAQILKAEPFLKLSSGHEAYHYQLFVEKDEHLILPTVQQLFEQSFISSDIKLKEVPSCLIIQMPRFGKSYKMYPRILPSQLLDVTDVIENSPRQCTVCGGLAIYECKECFNCYYEGLQCIAFCSTCVKTVHSHQERANHKWRKLLVPPEFLAIHKGSNNIPRLFMELFAVVCIETSHYVTFAKCGMDLDSWCFFDSMADRTGGQNGYNIPEMVSCPDLPQWLSEDGAQSLCDIKDDRHLPEYAKRLLCDAYMCMYQSTDVMMYH